MPTLRLLVLAGVLLVSAHADARAIAVAWNDRVSGKEALAALDVAAPFGFLTGVVETGRNVVLQQRGSRLYAISKTDDTLTVVDQRRPRCACRP